MEATELSREFDMSFVPEELRQTLGDYSEIRCICGFTHDDGYTIACDQCDTWQHVYCMDSVTASTSRYECPECFPRPLDVRRAVEYQQYRLNLYRETKQKMDKQQRAEERNKKKKAKSGHSASISRKKESKVGAHANSLGPLISKEYPHVASKSPGNTEGRKRGHRRSHTEPHIDHPDPELEDLRASHAPTEMHSESGSDVDMDRTALQYDYTDISDGSDSYMTREARKIVESIASSPESPDVRHFTRQQFAAYNFPHISIHSRTGLETSFPIPYQISLKTKCEKGQLLTPFKGNIGLLNSYKTEAINQYSILKHPKPYVLFHPSNDIFIDSRLKGTMARFVMRSCRPNTALTTLVIDKSQVVFALVAKTDIKPDTVLTIDWDWEGSPAMEKLARGLGPEQLGSNETKEAICWASNLAAQFGECACADKTQCMFLKLAVAKERCTPPLSSMSSSAKSRRDIAMTPISDAPSPDLRGSSERDIDGSSNTTQSRNISPAQSGPDEMSARDARKLQDAISRMNKAESAVAPKRRKRNSEIHGKSESGRKVKHASTAMSPPSDIPPNSMPTSVTKTEVNSLSRQNSDSPSVSSGRSTPAKRSLDMQSASPTATSKRIKRPVYVDACVQTDEPKPVHTFTVITDLRPPMSLKERLLKRVEEDRRREQEVLAKANAASQAKGSRKRKSEDEDDGVYIKAESPTAKSIKMSVDSDVKSPPAEQSPTDADVVMEDLPKSEPVEGSSGSVDTAIPEAPVESAKESEAVPEPAPSAQVPGPALDELFSAHSPEAVREETSSVEPKLEPTSLVSSSSLSTGRNYGLQVQLPTGPILDAASSSIPRTATSPGPLLTPNPSGQSPLGIPSENTCMLSLGPSTTDKVTAPLTPTTPNCNIPAAAKTKKLSLSEYGNRRKKADHQPTTATEKDKKPMKSVAEESAASVAAATVGGEGN